MKPILIALVLATFLIAPATVLWDAIVQREASDRTASERVGTAFQWPDEVVAANPTFAARILADAVQEVGVGVSRMTVEESAAGRKRIAYYVYLANSGSRLLQEFTLSEGRWMNPSESYGDSVLVASSEDDNSLVVGAPEILGDAYDLKFAPLHTAFEGLPAAGRYVIDSQDRAEVDKFVDAVHLGIAKMYGEDLDVSLVQNGSATLQPASSSTNLKFISFAFVPMIAVVVVSILRREAKCVGVMRMHGFSISRIWYAVVGKLELLLFNAGIIVTVVLVLFVPGSDSLLVLQLAGSLLVIMASAVAASWIFGSILIMYIPVTDLVKGRLR